MKAVLLFFPIFFFCQSLFGQQGRTHQNFEKAKKEFNIITTKEFSTLNCAHTINESKMKSFFQVYPQFNQDVKVVAIPNCYGQPNEKFFVLLYDDKKKFYVPRSLPDVYAGSNDPFGKSKK